MRRAKRRHRNGRVARTIVPASSVSTRPERKGLGLAGDQMVNAMDRVSPLLNVLYKAV
jgi:hypothetical protein